MEKLTLKQLRDDDLIYGQESMIDKIIEHIDENGSIEDGFEYYKDVKFEKMSEDPRYLLNEAELAGIDNNFKEVVERLKNLKPRIEPVYTTATYRCDSINAETIPENIDVDIIEIGERLEFRFKLDDDSVYWLAKMLGTEPKYLAEYEYIVTYRV